MKKKDKRLSQAFGIDEYGYPITPNKISSSKIAMILDANDGWDFWDDYWMRRGRGYFTKSWKRHRKTQYKL